MYPRLTYRVNVCASFPAGKKNKISMIINIYGMFLFVAHLVQNLHELRSKPEEPG